jgi:hypothetical protein
MYARMQGCKRRREPRRKNKTYFKKRDAQVECGKKRAKAENRAQPQPTLHFLRKDIFATLRPPPAVAIPVLSGFRGVQVPDDESLK